MRVLLLSAYAAGSHLQWQRNLEAMFPDWQWCVLTLPPRHFSWRVRGNPLYWALEQRQVLEADHQLLLATSMVDLATLRGLVPGLAKIPSILYFHENQFDYPQRQQANSLVEAQMVSLYGALAADRIVFNSAWNRDSFLAGCRDLLGRLPDYVPAGTLSLLEAKASLLPVPLQLDAIIAAEPAWPAQEGGDFPQRPLRLIWLGRFEHDKGAEGLLEILQCLEAGKLDYQLAVTGQRFRSVPGVFDQLQQQFAHRIVQFGYVQDVADYHSLLAAADMALSTALHEFQGLAMLEAVAAGCIPVVPERLAYPEIYPPRYRYPSTPGDQQGEALGAAALIEELAGELARCALRAPSVSAFSAPALLPAYRETLCTVAAQATGRDSQ